MEKLDKFYEVIAHVSYTHCGKPIYARINFSGRVQWKTESVAKKHAWEYKANHMRDAWVQEVVK